MKKIWMFIGLMLTYTQSHASAPDIIGKPYEQARTDLIEQGFKPLTREQIQTTPNQPDMPNPGVSEMLSKGYTEVSSCTGAGVPLCRFLVKNREGGVFEVTVYVPEDGGTTRVEKFIDTYTQMASAEIRLNYKTLQDRIAITNSKRTKQAFSLLTPCDSICILKEVIKNQPMEKEVGIFIDTISGYEILDFRGKNIVQLQSILPSYQLSPQVSTRSKDLYSNDLAYVVDQVTQGAVNSCNTATDGVTQCYLLFNTPEGYLYRINASGRDLADFTVKDVSIVNGEPEYSAYTSNELAVELQTKKRNDLFQTDKHAFRVAMREQMEGSSNTFVLYANALADSTYSSAPCDIFVSQAYMYALGNFSDTVKASMVDQMSSVLYSSGCVKLEYR